MTITLPELPYSRHALSPFISTRTIDFHHGKHHRAYVDALNKLLAERPESEAPLEEIIRGTAGDASQVSVFNNAAQAWNHSFYWNSMKPKGGGRPTGPIANAIKMKFGDWESFGEAFSSAAARRFGSGWVWLVANNGVLEIRSTPNAMTPFTEPGVTPLLTMDVWEHAYYLDYQNKRSSYVAEFIKHLLNWDFVNANFEKV